MVTGRQTGGVIKKANHRYEKPRPLTPSPVIKRQLVHTFLPPTGLVMKELPFCILTLTTTITTTTNATTTTTTTIYISKNELNKEIHYSQHSYKPQYLINTSRKC